MFKEFVETKGDRFSVGYTRLKNCKPKYAFTISMCHLQDKFQLEQFIEKVREFILVFVLRSNF